MKKLLVPVLAIALIAVSCNKLTSANTQTPAQSIVTTDTLVDTLIQQNSGAFDLGYEFHTTKTGTITQLGCLVPAKDSTYRVSLWDVPTQTLLATVTIKITDSLHFIYSAIAPVSITLNHDYLVSMNTYDITTGGSLPFYVMLKKNGSAANILPFTIRDISIDANFDDNNTSNNPAFPGTAVVNFALLPVDVGFQPK